MAETRESETDQPTSQNPEKQELFRQIDAKAEDFQRGMEEMRDLTGTVSHLTDEARAVGEGCEARSDSLHNAVDAAKISPDEKSIANLEKEIAEAKSTLTNAQDLLGEMAASFLSTEERGNQLHTELQANVEERQDLMREGIRQVAPEEGDKMRQVVETVQTAQDILANATGQVANPIEDLSTWAAEKAADISISLAEQISPYMPQVEAYQGHIEEPYHFHQFTEVGQEFQKEFGHAEAEMGHLRDEIARAEEVLKSLKAGR